jgi:hypothetical protein
MAWAPDGLSIAYLLSEEYCPPGETHVVILSPSNAEPVHVLASKDPSFVDVAWQGSTTLTLIDEGGNSWSLNLTTRQLSGSSN